MSRQLETLTVETVFARWPFVQQQLADNGLGDIADRPEARLAELLDADQLSDLDGFIGVMEEFLGTNEEKVGEVTITGGRAKDGSPEPVTELTVKVGEVICIVGPTGSGKSRLLADIEWVARGDTPTGRHVTINGQVPDDKWRFSSEYKLVAQLSQNMNFVMDLSVEEFLNLHAESRLATDPQEKIQRIWNWANELAGEPFALDTPVTSLSGGQSRALMIADTAVLSSSPVVLIDEIENAGIDRQQALDILIREEKIVLMATHDPILALMGDRRVIINNGAMQKVIEPSEAERANLKELRALDAKLMSLRHRLRMGERLDRI
ncbi:MAG: ATP-binding cassette domain-containing protein [Candidatus Krumholzibacteria bacterium]|nr:ATP-binding cassette domain-containing protein [Candidatus Krumholzibacteria bacterium]